MFGGIKIKTYYVTVDTHSLSVNINKYVFDVLRPNGEELTLLSIGYSKKSGFTLKEAKKFCVRICNVLNRTKWDKIKPVYYR